MDVVDNRNKRNSMVMSEIPPGSIIEYGNRIFIKTEGDGDDQYAYGIDVRTGKKMMFTKSERIYVVNAHLVIEG